MDAYLKGDHFGSVVSDEKTNDDPPMVKDGCQVMVITHMRRGKQLPVYFELKKCGSKVNPEN